MRTQAQCGQRLHGGGLNRASSLRRQPTVASRVAYPRKNPGAVSAQSAITNTLQCKSKHLTTTAINSSVESSPPSPAFAGSLHCRILNRPPGQLVALVPMMRCTGLVCPTEVRKTTCGPKWQHSCQAQSSTSSKNVPLRPLLSSILGRWLSRRRWETGRSSGAAWSCQQRRNR